MSERPQLKERHQKVLAAIVRHYVATAEPVSSKAIAGEYDLAVSSATVRNAMGWLEKAGLVYQPHTSAGRVPSDGGYRIYVDRLMSPATEFLRYSERVLSSELVWKTASTEALFHQAAQLLATLSGYIALITFPQNSSQKLRHLQLVPLDAERVMLAIVTDTYATQSVLVDLPPNLTGDESGFEDELQILSNFLNRKLKGNSLAEVATFDWSELDREFARWGDWVSRLLNAIAETPASSTSKQILVRGIAEILHQPEFSQLQQVQMLLHLLEEEQDLLWPLMFEPPAATATQRVSVRIGTENPLEPMQICTLVSATYRQSDTSVGSVGVLGPTRMLYENAIALVEAAADYLSDTLSCN